MCTSMLYLAFRAQTIYLAKKPDTYRCISSSRGRLLKNTKIPTILGTVWVYALLNTVLSKIFVYIWHIYSRNVQKCIWPIRPPPPWRCRLVVISRNIVLSKNWNLIFFKFFKTKLCNGPLTLNYCSVVQKLRTVIRN